MAFSRLLCISWPWSKRLPADLNLYTKPGSQTLSSGHSSAASSNDHQTILLRLLLPQRSSRNNTNATLPHAQDLNQASEEDDSLVGNTRPSFLSLPPELLQHIAELLPVSSAATLAYCSRKLYYILGSKHWVALQDKTNVAEKIEFLGNLEKDMQQHILCHFCSKLHYVLDNMGPRNGYEEHPRLRGCLEECSLHMYKNYGYILYYKHLRSAMNRHLYGREHGIALEELYKYWSYSWKKSALQVTLSPRIIADEMLLHLNFRIYLSLSTISEYILQFREQDLEICPHLDVNFSANKLLLDTLACKTRHFDDRDCTSCNGLKQCRSCPTEFRLSVDDFGDLGHVIVLNVWKNLGSCRTPFDPTWQAHVTKYGSNDTLHGPIFSFAPGSVCTTFEQATGKVRARWRPHREVHWFHEEYESYFHRYSTNVIE